MTTSYTSMPALAALDEGRRRYAPGLIRGGAVVCVQHLLPSCLPLFDAIIEGGVRPEAIFILGKAYSTHPEVAEALRARGCEVIEGSWPSPDIDFATHQSHGIASLWERAERLRRLSPKCVVVLDDGGRCLSAVPGWARSIGAVGVEQTSRGWRIARNIGRVPTVLVARSAIKLICEAPIIGASVVKGLLLHTAGMDPRLPIGVIGAGPIGRAVAAELLACGRRVLVTDQRVDARRKVPFGAEWIASVREMTAQCSAVIGCTGESSLTRRDLRSSAVPGELVLASASSEDKEFRELLAERDPGGGARDITLVFKGRPVRILNGGYPINFARGTELESSEDMQVTRGALLAGVYQAACMAGHAVPGSPLFALDAELQQVVVRAWRTGSRACMMTAHKELWSDTSRIERCSGGRAWDVRSGWSSEGALHLWM